MASKWTPEKVALHLEEAILTLRHLPPLKKPGCARVWLDIVYTPNEKIFQPAFQRPIRMTPEAIERLEQTFDWMVLLEEDERKLLWKRAAQVPWKIIARELGCGRSTAWRRWVISCTKICEGLNSGNPSNTIKHPHGPSNTPKHLHSLFMG